MHELSSSLWDIFCTEEVWLNSSVQKTQEVQHADSTAAEKSSQSSHHVNSCAENLTEFKTAVKWACKSNTWQDENSN